MKRAIASIVLLLFVLYVETVPAYWVMYYLFADRIAAAYCVNPGNPNCHGRCHVAAATEKQERQDAPASEIKLDKVPLFIEYIEGSPALASYQHESYPESSRGEPAAGFAPLIDHPPLASI